MPRWFVVALTLVVYDAAMMLIWWGLKAWAPSGLETLRGLIGHFGIWVLLVAAGLACASIANRSRDEDDTRPPVLPCRE